MKTTLLDRNLNGNRLKVGFLLTLFLFLARCGIAQQSYLPNYSFTPTITTYTPITGGTLVDAGPLVDDNNYYGYNIGFPFNFNGTTYTTFSLNANGALVLGSSFGYVSNTSAMYDFSSANNVLLALDGDLIGTTTGEIRFDNFGTAPNRTMVLQWSNFGFWNSTGDTENFQIVLHETTNIIDYNYGIFAIGANDHTAEVGIRATYGDILNRATTTDWAATTVGSSMYDYCLLSANGPVTPYDGLTFTYSPPFLSYVSSDVSTASIQTIAPGSTNQKILGFNVNTYGMCGYLPLSAVTVNTTGTTNVGDISNLKIFYTGSSDVFSSAVQFGTTVSSPGSTNTITDSVNLSEGNNYFWIAYDLSSGATLGNFVDAEVSVVKVKNVNKIPSTTAPAGNRQIASPMAYLGSDAVQNAQKVGRGSQDNPIIQMKVVTSSTGAPVNATQFDLSANGTIDTSNIRNLKVWYTGNSSDFAATIQFGATLPYLPGGLSFSITGDQELMNDTNYFWLTYDIDASSVLGNLIDGEFTSATIGGVLDVPSVSAPAGTREVREEYCPPIVSQVLYTCSNGYYINSVYTNGAITDLNNTNSGCNGDPVNNYINYKNKTLIVNQNQSFYINIGDYTTYMTYAIWIDYNQDGLFDNVTERVFQSPYAGNYGNVDGSITIPCSALPGQTRMRIRGANYYWFYNYISNSCDDVGYGETEDYNVIIRENPVVYDYSSAEQQTGITAPGTMDLPVLRVEVSALQCGVPVATSFAFSTTGSTSTSDIVTAKLYKTGASDVFNTSTLIGTVASPSGHFTFATTDTLMANSTVYYWLAYDVSSSATLTHTLDATFDSIEAVGAYHVPFVGDPSGNITITSPMTYVSSDATQGFVQKVGRGTQNNQVMGLRVVTSSTGAPAFATQIDFNVNGTTNQPDVVNMKVWYTGSSNVFATTNQFGSDIPAIGGVLNYSATGNQQLLNDTNYFWITYDIDSASVVGNLVDGECTSVVLDGVSQTPTVTAPAGSREIREEYCPPVVSNAAFTCSNGYYVNSVYTYGAVSDIYNGYNGCNGNPVNNYINYADQTLVTYQNQTFDISLGDYYTYMTYAVWIDFNQDGIFDNITERVFQSPYTGNYGNVYGSINIPCTALPGQTRMRVRAANYWWSASFINDACADVGDGETEDYNVIIQENALSYSSTAEQTTGIAAPGTVNEVILSIPIVAKGCGVPAATEFRFSATGTTNVGDIVTANLYRTGNSNVFNTSTLVGSVSAPAAQFTIPVTDTLISNDVTYYWLTYDISGSATLSNTLDAVFDSIFVGGVYYVPADGDPAGNITVTAPMTYVSSEATQTFVQKIGRGSQDNQILGLKLVTSSTGATANATQVDFNLNGCTDPTNVVNMKVWYTGNSNTFATTNQFGSDIPAVGGVLNYSATGNQALVNDTNYFWITYDIDPTSTLGNLIDGECTSVTFDGTAHAPSVTAPAGSREIREEYCPPIVSNASLTCSYGYYISSIYTYGAVSDLSNGYSGCNGNPVNNYIHYTDRTLVVNQNQSFNISLGDYNTYMTYAVWIDFNQDGVFDNVTERVFQSPYTGDYGYVSGSISIPCSALPGQTRMRIRGADYWWSGTFIANSCDDVGYGETEDYDVVIQGNPVTYDFSYTEQQSGIAAPGTTDLPILLVQVGSSQCGAPIATTFKFSTTGSTNVSDIVSAKLYRTGTSRTFNTSTLLGTVASPSGQFTFSVSDTMVSNDVTYYWLAYDLNSAATLSNVIDATFDSIEAIGAYHTPIVGDPSGNIAIFSPMSYLGSEVTQTATQSVGRGTPDNQVVGIKITASSTGAPVYVTQFDLNVNGTTDTSNIRNLKVWYTGNSNIFSPNTQFGSTLPYLTGTTAFTITGTQPLMNDTNYFWLTYDVDAASALGNFIDGECTSFTLNGAPQTPSVTAPAGSREIRDDYCPAIVSQVSNSCNYGYYISTVYTSGATMDLYNSYSGCNGNPTNNYISYQNQTLVVNQNQSFTINLGDYSTYGTYAVWIDYNQDGVFDNVTERVFQSPYGGNYGYVDGSITVPCSALPGQTRMRVRMADYYWFYAYIANACDDVGYGETEDYNVVIVPNPVQYDYSQASQQTGIVAPGTVDIPVLRVEAGASQCGDPVAATFKFSTTGSTSASDIAAAKLYKTGSSTLFSTATLLGTVASPSGQFTFTVTDTMISNGVTNYWLAYDVSSSAITSNVLDATFDSVEAVGAYHIPLEGDPSGNITITSPMTYVSSEATQTFVQKIGRGSVDNQILGLSVVTSSSGAPARVTQVDFNLGGCTDATNVLNMKVWYTGNSNQFATATQFGSDIPAVGGVLNYSATGSQDLMNDTNYFWITYDIDPTSTLGNLIDGECTSVIVGGTPQTPSVTAPAGSREIREEYCDAIISNAAFTCSSGYYISSVATGRAVSDLNNYYSGCNGNPVNNYINYQNQTLVVNQNQSIDIYLGDYNTYLTYAVWIDYNQDGIFDNLTERVFQSPSGGNYGYVSGTINIPLTALTGQTRMRVRGGDYYWSYAYIPNACDDIGYGETEDYNVMILPEPPPASYAWNQTVPEDFTNPYNWTPNRLNPLPNDMLVFNTGGQIDVYNVNPQLVSSVIVDNATEVTLESYFTSTLSVTDTLALTSGKILTGTSLTLSVGSDTTMIGTIAGSGTIEGTLKRWVNPAVASYDFPLSYRGNNNAVNVTYTTPPSVGGSITAHYVVGEPGQLGLPLTDGAITASKASDFGVWKLKGANGLSGGTYTGTFTAEGITYVTSPSDLILLRRLVSIAMWTLHGTSVTTTGTASAPVLSRTGMTLFGDFGIGGDSTVNPLPVKLISFQASAVKGDVLTSWTTASESNNAGFEVLRSVDGKTFTGIGFVKSKGNSNTLVNYTDLDREAFASTGVNTLYYRLRQIDLDGKEWMSQIVSVTNTDNKLSSISAYPNPFTSKLNLDIVSTEDASFNLTILDIQGRVVFASNLKLTAGRNAIPVDGLDALNAGIYFVRVSGSETKTIKLVKTNQQ